MSDDTQSRPTPRPFLASDDAAGESSSPMLPPASLEEPLAQPAPSEPVDKPLLPQSPSTNDDAAPMLPPVAEEKKADGEAVMTHKTAELSPEASSEHAPILPPMPHYAKSEPLTTVVDDHEANASAVATSGRSSHSLKKVGWLGGGGVVAAIVIGVVVYGLNQDVYSLFGQPEEAPRQVGQVVPTQSGDAPSTLAAISGQKKLTLTLPNLENLEEGHYQLWVKQGDETKSLGIFTVNDQDQPVDGEGKPLQPEVVFGDEAVTILVTVESGSELKEEPSATVMLSGDITAASTNVFFKAIDFNSLSGTYVLATPTATDAANSTSGLWLATTDGQKLTGPGLKLPKAPAGWIYEGQMLYKNQIVAMGRFKDVAAKDNFERFTPNPDRTPSFPGEDYLQGAPSRLGLSFPTNLASGDWKFLLTLEPDVNGVDPSGDGSFFIHLLEATIAKDSAAWKEYPLTVSSQPVPSLKVVVE